MNKKPDWIRLVLLYSCIIVIFIFGLAKGMTVRDMFAPEVAFYYVFRTISKSRSKKGDSLK